MKDAKVDAIELTPGGIATLACLLEVAAPKPGNVHRGADFEDVTLADFMASAVALGQVIDAKGDQIGDKVLAAVQATSAVAGSNTNLGMILLLVPLSVAAKMNGGSIKADAIAEVLDGLTTEDSVKVFQAIKLARPGGLGSVEKLDVNDSGQNQDASLIEAMQLAAKRDQVAAQYANGFDDIFNEVVPLLVDGRNQLGDLTQGIVYAHLAMMAKHPDSLIARKCGQAIATESQTRAQQVLDAVPDTADDRSHERFWTMVGDLDFWLRSDGHRRNPGTTADLIAAGLFAAIANGDITAPFR